LVPPPDVEVDVAAAVEMAGGIFPAMVGVLVGVSTIVGVPIRTPSAVLVAEMVTVVLI
jgi:hypothetical protein